MKAREELNKIKEYLAITTDIELSEALNVNKRNIESWVKRDKIPDKWRMIIAQKYDKSEVSETKNNKNDSLSVSLLQAGAGEGVYNFETQETLLSLNPTVFSRFTDQSLTAVEIVGDSMEPELFSGDYIIITPPSESRSTEDGIYAIRIDGMVKVKALQFLLDGTIKIISYNQNYSEETYNPSTSQVDFAILGKLRIHLTFK